MIKIGSLVKAIGWPIGIVIETNKVTATVLFGSGLEYNIRYEYLREVVDEGG